MCNNFHGGFECECFSGYQLSQLTECLPICEPECQNNGLCSGSNVCDCPDTYKGDRCETDVDECLVNNGGCDHSCENQPGTFRCSCRDGFIGTNICTDIDECSFANCHNCTNSAGSFECRCKTGYEAHDLYNCKDIDECATGTAGCGQNCSNSIGSFSCDCKNGWTLDPDKKGCTANPCVEIGEPFGGKRTCSGFTTDETCAFECERGHILLGSASRECLSDGMWSGQVTQCKEILCPEVSSPSNGYIQFPCENQAGSRCRFGCDVGYFLEENIVAQCLLSGKWNSTFPKCIETQVCLPSPCVNGACRVAQNEIRYICDCSGTGYTGAQCAQGLVTTPDWPDVFVGGVYNVTFIAKPKHSLDLTIRTDPDGVIIDPGKLSFTSKLNALTVSVRGVKHGFVKISYVLRGKEAPKFHIPDGEDIFVLQTNVNKSFPLGYNLPTGCFALSDQSTCAGLNYRSTDEWKTNNIAADTNGIVSLKTDTFELPLSLVGQEITSSSTMTVAPNNKCLQKDVPFDNVQHFVQFNSLYRNYTRELEHVFPDWITFISVDINPMNAKTSTSTLSLRGSEVKSLEWCSYAPVDKDGHYSVFLLSKVDMIIGGRLVSLPVPPFKGKYCFIVGVCELASRTVMMVFPEGSRNVLSYIRNVNLNGDLEVDVNFLMLNLNAKEKISILANLQYSYYINKHVPARVEGSGDAHISLEDVTHLFSHLFVQRWELKQIGNSKISLYWKMFGEDVELNFISNQGNRPILNCSMGVDGLLSSERGIKMESSTSFGVFDNTPFFRLLKTSDESVVEVFVDYDLSPKLDIPSDLNTITAIIRDLQTVLLPQLNRLPIHLRTIGYDALYLNLQSASTALGITLQNYFTELTRQDLKLIANSLAELRMQCKRTLVTLWSVNDELIIDPNLTDLRTFAFNVTSRLENLSNKILLEVQDVFADESMSGSGFRLTSEVCLSSQMCFPSIKVDIVNSITNCLALQSINQATPTICLTGEYSNIENINQFISIPAGSNLNLTFESNNDHWHGNIPVYIKLLGIEQETVMYLTAMETRFTFSGKLWGSFDMIGNATSRLSSFESMILFVNGEISADGPSTLGRIVKEKIISFSKKSVDDSERRLSQASKKVELAKSKLQSALNEETVQNATVDKAKDKHDSAEKEVKVGNLEVEKARTLLENKRDDTKKLEEQLNSVCKVDTCNGVCFPGSKIVTKIEDVYAFVPYECCSDRDVSKVVNETTSCCWICYIPTPVKSFSLNPIKIVTAAFHIYTGNYLLGAKDLVTSVEKSSRESVSKGECCEDCKKAVSITVTFESCSTCVNYEVIGQIEKIETEAIPCNVQLPDANCVRQNEECRKKRNRIFDQIKKIAPDIAVPIENVDKAVLRASIAEAELNVALIELDDALNQQKEVSNRVLALQKHLDNAQRALNKIRTDVQAALVIKQHQIDGSIKKSLKIKEIKFNIDIAGEDTSVIPLVFYMSLSSTPVQVQIFIDANNLDYTIEKAALFITEELFGDITRSIRRKRGVGSRRLGLRKNRDTTNIIHQPPIEMVKYNVVNNSLDLNITSELFRDQRVVQNENRCKEFNDILGFIEHSFETLLEIVDMTNIAEIQSINKEEEFHSEYMYNLSVSTSPNVINNSSALLYFNLTVEDLEETNTTYLIGVQQGALSQVIDSAKIKAENTKSLLAVDVMTKWETVMDMYTRNSSGLTDCEGFYDCLTTELISLIHLSEDRHSYQNTVALDSYVATFLNSTISNIDEAKLGGVVVLSQVTFLKDNNDVCLEVPVISQHPKPNITTIEGGNITLTCEATGRPSPTFSWTFNGQPLDGKYSNLLHLEQVNSSTAGTYACQASNAVTSVSSLQCDVKVEFAPLITEHPTDTTIEYGNIEGAFLTCQAFAQPLADYQWYFQASSSSDMEAIPGQNSSSIEILSPEFNQDGWYTCGAWNEHGRQLSDPARLHVLGISMPEFSSPITIHLYRADFNSTEKHMSLEGAIANVIDINEFEPLNYQELDSNGKSFLTRIRFEIKSTNATSIDMTQASRNESAYQVKHKIERVLAKVTELQSLLTPGEQFEHRGYIVEVTEFKTNVNGPICPSTQYAHSDGYICVNCPPGSYRGNDNLPAVCQLCPKGFYQPKEGQMECLKCNGYTNTDTGSIVCNRQPPSGNMPGKPTDKQGQNVWIYAVGGAGGGFVCLLFVVVFTNSLK
ncbi:uncharacterized protein [Antedon mediterranea]|uniref:uncharacterized protein n=1 Tax=Antedon mediterranea TaxID=105859 RepID=UPI003AF4ED8B